MRKSLYVFLIGFVCLHSYKTIAQAQPAGCQVLKKMMAPLYYSAENLRSDTMDILKYTINLEIGTAANPVIKGNTQIRFAPKLNNRLFIRLDLLELFVDSVKEGNNLLSYTYNDTIIKADFISPKNVIDTSVITVYYHGTPQIDGTGWGGFYFDNTQGADYAFNLGVGFGAKPHNYGRVWFPCFDNFVEHSKYEFNITCDTARRSYCNGQLVSDVVNGVKRTRKWILNEQIPTYLASVALAKYSQVNWNVNTLNGNKAITLAAHATDTNALKSGFANLINCIHGFENYYGPYQWPRFGYCLVPFSSGAMEHATNIAYPRAFIGNLAYESSLMAHELSHHWWGDLVTCETQEDMWINEGLATYSGYLFLEWQYGKNNYLNAIKNEHEQLLHFLHKNEGGFRAISGVPHSLTYGDHVYKKGADVAHTLRGYMGDTQFFNAIKYVMQQKANKNVNSIELRNLMQTSSGQSLTDFFNNWVLSGGWSHFAIDSVKYIPNGATYDAVIHLKQKLYGAINFHNNVPLEVSFFKNDWSRVVKSVVMSGATGTFTVNIPFVPAYYALNYDSKINDATSHETKVIKGNGNNNYALGKLFLQIQNKGADSSLLRVIHNYVKPDDFKVNTKGHILSNQHFWRVEGLLSPGFKSKARFNYDGTKALSGNYAYLDTLLTIVNGDSIGLFYRKDATYDWVWLRYAVKTKTSLRTGNIEIDSLMLGEYTFGNVGDTSTTFISESSSGKTPIRVFPNPTSQIFDVDLSQTPETNYELFVYSLDGRLVKTEILLNCINKINMGHINKGTYLLEVRQKKKLVYKGKILLQ